MQNQQPKMDEETLAFLQQVFQLVRGGQAEEFREYLVRGLPPNLRNEKGDSLLMIAAYNGHPDVVKLLLEHGADAELANDRGQTPLAAAAFKGDIDVINILLDSGADVDGGVDGGRTALMTAAMFNRTEIVDLLLERGADIDRRDATGPHRPDGGADHERARHAVSACPRRRTQAGSGFQRSAVTDPALNSRPLHHDHPHSHRSGTPLEAPHGHGADRRPAEWRRQSSGLVPGRCPGAQPSGPLGGGTGVFRRNRSHRQPVRPPSGHRRNPAPVVAGSHLDTQPTGGKFDGAFGVLAAFEALQAINEAGIVTRRPIEVVSWTNEEGSRFQPGCSGSSAFTGAVPLEKHLDAVDRDGITARDALAAVLSTERGMPIRPLGLPDRRVPGMPYRAGAEAGGSRRAGRHRDGHSGITLVRDRGAGRRGPCRNHAAPLPARRAVGRHRHGRGAGAPDVRRGGPRPLHRRPVRGIARIAQHDPRPRLLHHRFPPPGGIHPEAAGRSGRCRLPRPCRPLRRHDHGNFPQPAGRFRRRR